MRHLTKKIIFATGNQNKLKEIRAMIQTVTNTVIDIIGLDELGHMEELEESGSTLTENAVQKATFIYNKYGAPVFSEDTGLEVDSLGGAPGVSSARYAGPQKNADDNIDKLLSELQGQTNREAQFRTILAYKTHDKLMTFHGIVRGNILEKRQGQGGFGYDPIFKPDGFSRSFGELPGEVKQRISHRADAFSKFIEYLEAQELT